MYMQSFHYEPLGQNVSTVSQISLNWFQITLKDLNLVSNVSQNVSIWSYFETFLTFETQLRLSPKDLFHCFI